MKISDNNDIAFEKFPVQQSDYERREGQVMDWNHDGKHDWEDDTLFHAVIDNDDSEKESFFSSNRNTSRDRKSSWLSTVIPMIYLGLFFAWKYTHQRGYHVAWTDLCWHSNLKNDLMDRWKLGTWG